MPYELAIAGLYFPTILLVFLACFVIYGFAVNLLSHLQIESYIWHAALFHIALFFILFSVVSLLTFFYW